MDREILHTSEFIEKYFPDQSKIVEDATLSKKYMTIQTSMTIQWWMA